MKLWESSIWLVIIKCIVIGQILDARSDRKWQRSIAVAQQKMELKAACIYSVNHVRPKGGMNDVTKSITIQLRSCPLPTSDSNGCTNMLGMSNSLYICLNTHSLTMGS
jgi:hypothetical protein